MLAGGLMHRCRTACLDDLGAPEHTLFLGEGPGRMLREMALRFPEMRCTVIDESASMIRQSRAMADAVPGLAGRCEWMQRDVFSWLEAVDRNKDAFDLVVTCFFLDCFDPAGLGRLISGISSRMPPGSRWLIADFSIPVRGPAHWRARGIVGMLYVFFRFVAGLQTGRLEDTSPFLAASGWKREARHELDWGLMACELWVKG